MATFDKKLTDSDIEVINTELDLLNSITEEIKKARNKRSLNLNKIGEKAIHSFDHENFLSNGPMFESFPRETRRRLPFFP